MLICQILFLAPLFVRLEHDHAEFTKKLDEINAKLKVAKEKNEAYGALLKEQVETEKRIRELEKKLKNNLN